MNKKTILNISNFNIMSPSSAKYFFTKNNLILDNHEKTLDKIVNINELQLRLPYIRNYIFNYLNNNSLNTYSQNTLDILSLEEVHFKADYFRKNIGSYQSYFTQITKPFFSSNESWEQDGDYMITYINNNKIKIIKNYTSEYQIYYNSKEGGNFVSSINGFKYPSRTQIFLLQKENHIFFYVHIHAPGLPDDVIKFEFFSCLNKYLLIINQISDYPIIIIGDMNDDDINKITSWLPNLNLVGYIDPFNRETSYHRIINLGNPFNIDYLKSDTITSRYFYSADKNIFELRQVDESVYKKVDQLLYSNNRFKITKFVILNLLFEYNN